MRYIADHTGKRVHMWTVLYRSPRKARKPFWVCQCDCGTIREVASSSITTGNSKCCGCVKYDQKGKPKGGKPIEWEREGSCIVCTSHKLSHGYPTIRRGKFSGKLHRLIMFRRTGIVGRHVEARHTCDNPRCIRPDHIIPGTKRQNQFDKVERNRQAKGESSGNHKLTEKEVIEIRNSTENAKLLSKIYSVRDVTIYDIRKRKTWKHIP